MTMSETNILKLKTFVYFENKLVQLGAFKWNMHEQTSVDGYFDAGYQQALFPSTVCGQRQEWKKQNEKHENE